jgi:hypothetical protein
VKKSILTLSVMGMGAFAQAATADDYCREYTEKITINGASHTAYGTACRQADGTWKKVAQPDKHSKKRRRHAHSDDGGGLPVVKVVHHYPRRVFYRPHGIRHSSGGHHGYVRHRDAYPVARYGPGHGRRHSGYGH